MLRDVELPIFPEICVIHKMDKNLGVEPHELPFLMQSLIVRGWIWQMPAKYQHMAVQMLNAGVIADVKPEKEPEEMDKKKKVCVEIAVRDGHVATIKTSGEVIDVKIVDHDNTTTVCYSSFGVDGNPIWVGDDTVEEDGDTQLEED
tara:strand:- start:306 stop:743 length:438 start_codon:yes stop_codon:yes gene_type:complete